MAKRFKASRIALTAPKAKLGLGIGQLSFFLLNYIKFARYAFRVSLSELHRPTIIQDGKSSLFLCTEDKIAVMNS
ncbi:MAG: hypothetical protein E7003_02315 [Eggerthellaceae bacterium]|nr:hypothetical protein [Eggerthellaceae bacterium]